jgi:hypothetical protein
VIFFLGDRDVISSLDHPPRNFCCQLEEETFILGDEKRKFSCGEIEKLTTVRPPLGVISFGQFPLGVEEIFCERKRNFRHGHSESRREFLVPRPLGDAISLSEIETDFPLSTTRFPFSTDPTLSPPRNFCWPTRRRDDAISSLGVIPFDQFQLGEIFCELSSRGTRNGDHIRSRGGFSPRPVPRNFLLSVRSRRIFMSKPLDDEMTR